MKIKISLYLSLLLISASSIAANKILSSDISFVAKGKPSFIKAKGNVLLKEADIKLNGNNVVGSFIVDLTTLDSGIELRDDHVKNKYIDVKKFPLAKITFNESDLQVDSSSKKVKAILEFHGVKKPVELTMTCEKNKKIIHLSGSFSLSLTQFEVELPSFQGITAAEKVKITIDSKVQL